METMYMLVGFVAASPAICYVASATLTGIRQRIHLNRCLQRHQQFTNEQLMKAGDSAPASA